MDSWYASHHHPKRHAIITVDCRNLRLVKLLKRALQNITKATSWATKFASSFLTVVEGLRNTATTLVLASSVVKSVIGLGKSPYPAVSFELSLMVMKRMPKFYLEYSYGG